MKKVYLLFFSCLIFFKCTKRVEASVSPENTKTKLLTARKWNVYKYTIGTPNTPTRSISQLASEKNNGQYYTDFSYAYVIFRNDGTYTSLDVDKKVNDNYTWEWTNNETEVVISNPKTTDSRTNTVTALDANKLTLQTNFKKGVTPDDKWNELAADLRSHGFGIGFTEIYIITEYDAEK